MRITLGDARIVTPGGEHHGWLTVEGGRITEIGYGQAPAGAHPLGGRIVVPGFVDMHTHGGAGASFPDGDPERAVHAIEFHQSHGSTTIVASLVTAAASALARAAGALAELCDQGLLAGIHLEGPYLARARCGAHDPTLLREPSRAEFHELVHASRGHVRMITIAAELPGALDVIRDAVGQGVIAALGHSDADYEQAIDAIDAGVTVATHLYNAMPPLGHRQPGPVAALVQDERVTIELINDGVHVHPAMLRLAIRTASAGRTALITDAMAAAGMNDGEYRLGSMTVDVAGGVARLTEGGAIAGSTLTMDVAFRRTVRDVGVSLSDAARMASLTPARRLGLDGRTGSIEVGKDADLVVLSEDLRVERVMRHGVWLPERAG